MIFTREQAKAADKELYDAMLVVADKQARLARALDTIHRVAGDSYRRRYDSRSGWKLTDEEARAIVTERADTDTTYNGREAQSVLEKLTDAGIELDQARAAKALADKWADHGQWLRYAVVPGGHIHNNDGCFTLRWDTDVRWAYQISGDSVAEAIATYGEALCSHCYPDAPVAQTLGKVATDPNGHPITKAEAQAAQAAKEAEKAAKLAAKNAAAVIDPATGKVLFKTERGATNDIASDLGAYLAYNDERYLNSAKATIAAVAAKRGVDPEALLAEMLDKATKKFRREAIKSIKQMLLTAGRAGYQDMSDPDRWRENYRWIAREEGLV